LSEDCIGIDIFDDEDPEGVVENGSTSEIDHIRKRILRPG